MVEYKKLLNFAFYSLLVACTTAPEDNATSGAVLSGGAPSTGPSEPGSTSADAGAGDDDAGGSTTTEGVASSGSSGAGTSSTSDAPATTSGTQSSSDEGTTEGVRGSDTAGETSGEPDGQETTAPEETSGGPPPGGEGGGGGVVDDCFNETLEDCDALGSIAACAAMWPECYVEPAPGTCLDALGFCDQFDIPPGECAFSFPKCFLP